MRATFTPGHVIPEYAYFVFQMTFAMITPALIIGAFAERMKFSSVMLFILLWVTVIYFPIAHWVWGTADPNALVDAATATRGGGRRGGEGGRAGQDRRDQRRRRLARRQGRAGLRRRHGGAHQRGHRRSRRRDPRRQAHRLWQGRPAAAFADHVDDRRLAAVGRLVRLQRRLQPRGQWDDGAGLRQHHGRHRRRGAVVAARPNGR